MTVMAWEHLVRDVMPRLEAEQKLRLASAASVPHMDSDSARDLVNTWQRDMLTTVRAVGKIARDQGRSFRRWLGSWGINPDTGQTSKEERQA